MIPKRLTQTWKSKTLPPGAARLRETWLRRNPDFTCRLFDDADCETLVAETFPEHVDAFRRLPFPVMRADIFRYAAIFRDGGLYADIDMECLRPVSVLLSSASCVLAVEAHLGRRRTLELGYAKPVQIANCIFAAVPGHPFFLAAAQRAFALAEQHPSPDRAAVEDITGPRMLTRLLFEGGWEGVSVTPQIALMAPLSYPAVWPLNRGMFARHHTFGTWKGEQKVPLSRRWIERNRLPNPFPSRLVVPAAHLGCA